MEIMDIYRKYCAEDKQKHLDELGYRKQGLSFYNSQNQLVPYNEVAQVTNELSRLCRCYGAVYYGVRHQAPCGTWRSEMMQLARARLSRFANRLHLFQQRGDRCGRYIGYIHLRPRVLNTAPDGSFQFRYASVAYLALPAYMLRARYHMITCLSGPADGVEPFRSIPFATPNNDTGNNALCAHAALQEALLLKMTSFGTEVINCHEMIAALVTLRTSQTAKARRSRSRTYKQLLETLEGMCGTADAFPALVNTLRQATVAAENTAACTALGNACASLRVGMTNLTPQHSPEMLDVSAQMRKLAADTVYYHTSVMQLQTLALSDPARTTALQALDKLHAPMKRALHEIRRVQRDPHILDLMHDIAKKGVSLPELRDVINMNRFAGGLHEQFIADQPAQPLAVIQARTDWPVDPEVDLVFEALRVLTDYLANGIPVILRLDGKHAVLAVGMHLLQDEGEDLVEAVRQQLIYLLTGTAGDGLTPISLPISAYAPTLKLYELPGRLVMNDVKQGPFYEQPIGKLLASLWTFPQGPALPNMGSIAFLAVTPRGARLRMSAVRRFALECYTKRLITNPTTYLRTQPEGPDNIRLTVRMYRTEQLLQRYFRLPQVRDALYARHLSGHLKRTPISPGTAPDPEKQRESELINQTIADGEFLQAKTEAFRALDDNDDYHEAQYWWSAEIYQVKEQPAPHPLAIYLWPITQKEVMKDKAEHEWDLRSAQEQFGGMTVPEQSGSAAYVNTLARDFHHGHLPIFTPPDAEHKPAVTLQLTEHDKFDPSIGRYTVLLREGDDRDELTIPLDITSA